MCFFPRLIRPPKTSILRQHVSFLVIPCGSCPQCIAALRRDWRFRAYQEFIHSQAHRCGYESTKTNPLPRTRLFPSNLFVTFTLSDDYLVPQTPPIQYWRAFKDRWRKSFPGTPFPAYLCVPEYGDAVHHSGRLHFHAVLFDVPAFVTNSDLERLWSYGFVFVGSYFDLNSVWYSTKYIQKTFTPGQYKNQSLYAPPNFKPRPFASNGFGACLFDEYHSELDFARHVPLLFELNGFKYPLPRYYTRKLGSTSAKHILYLRMYEGRKYVFEGEEYDLSSVRDYVTRVRLHNNAFTYLSPVQSTAEAISFRNSCIEAFDADSKIKKK